MEVVVLTEEAGRNIKQAPEFEENKHVFSLFVPPGD